MRFKKITFKNYRCFMDGTINFKEADGKNINLIVAPNGGGKTEMLFAFWWCLYGLDFSIMTGKEVTSYALNSTLYRDLMQSESNKQYSCFVEIEFEDEGKDYFLKRMCEYRNTGKKILCDEYQILSHYNDKHELIPPIRDKEGIEKTLKKVLPKSILHGIIFDGEQMIKLNKNDKQSIEAIHGIISNITNVELVQRVKKNLEGIKENLDTAQKKLSNKTGNKSLTEILVKLEKNEAHFSQLKGVLSDSKLKLSEYESRTKEISNELRQINLISDLEKERANVEKERKRLENDLDDFYKDFAATLSDGYLMISSKLLDEVNLIIQKYDVPEGLTVKAVKSILSRDTCICGRELDDDAILKLNELILSLPPDNINSTLMETLRFIKELIKDVKRQSLQQYHYIDECEKNIKKCKEKYADISTEILRISDTLTEKDKFAAKELEKERTAKIEIIGMLKKEIPELEKKIDELEKEINSLKEKRSFLSANQEEHKILLKQIEFVEKSIAALSKIEEKNKNKALSEINRNIEKAYNILSEDADFGKSIRIIQYDNEQKDKIVVFFKKDQENKINEWKQNGEYDKLKQLNKDDDEIIELAILKVGDGNSTGQSKINTLSFVKAILDYSNSEKTDDILSVKRKYPLLIDAPFSDIAGKNLVKSSKLLYSFAEQVILMLDNDKYEQVKNNLQPYISNIYEFVKCDGTNSTNIKLVKEV